MFLWLSSASARCACKQDMGGAVMFTKGGVVVVGTCTLGDSLWGICDGGGAGGGSLISCSASGICSSCWGAAGRFSSTDGT